MIGLSNDELMTKAPSIFATVPFMGMSQHYKFVPTIEIIDNLRGEGFFPVMTSQSKTSCPAKIGFQKHMVKFRQEAAIGDKAVVGKEVAEVVLINSHDGSSLLFRFVCGNGMVVMQNDMGSYHVKHNGLIADLLETTYEITQDFPKAFAQIEHMKSTMMNPFLQLEMAGKALEIIRPAKPALVIDNATGEEVKPVVIDASLLLNAKREDDERLENGNRDLWTAFNVIQENVIKGGIAGQSAKRKTKSRPIAAIQENIRVNRELWQLASSYAVAA